VNFISFIYASFVTDINECSQAHNHTCINNFQKLDWWLLNRILTLSISYRSTHHTIIVCVSIYNTTLFLPTVVYLVVTDIDECAQTHKPCNQTCTNTIGSFTCFCNPGYTLEPDKTNCKGNCRQNFLCCNYLYEHDVKMYNYRSMYLMMGAKQNIYYNDSATSKTLLTLSFCQGINNCFNKQSF